MAKILNTLSHNALVALIQSGAVGILPMDTVYGLVCSASDEAAVKRLYRIKSRENKPGTVIACSTDQLVELGIKARYLKAVTQFWPNAISIEIPNQISYLNQSTGRQAFRVIKQPVELLNLLGITGPLLTSSANLPGEKPAGTIAEAQKSFGESIDFYVDGGNLSGHKPSTLIRIVDDAVEVLREGAVNIEEETGRIL